MDIKEKLDLLAELKHDVEILQEQHDIKRAEILKPVLGLMADLETETVPLFESAASKIEALTKEIQDEALAGGESVRGKALQAVFIPGRESWDTHGLEGYALVHPEVMALKKTGEPSIRIMVIRK
jgi:hypothetical protein